MAIETNLGSRPARARLFRAGRFLLVGASIVAVALLGGRTALAGSASRAPVEPSVGAEPQQTTASFGDWVVRCARVQRAGGSVRLCEVAESLVLQGERLPIAQVAIGTASSSPAERGMRLTMLLPVNVSFDQLPRLGFAANDSKPIVANWRRCAPAGCFADAPLSAELLGRLRTQKTPMSLSLKDASERAIALPLSPRGLPQALDALAKEDARGNAD